MNKFVLALVAIIALIAFVPFVEAGSYVTFDQFGNPVVVNTGYAINNVRTLAVVDGYGSFDAVYVPVSGFSSFHTVGFNGCNSGFRSSGFSGRGNVTINNFNGSRGFNGRSFNRPVPQTAAGAAIQAFRIQRFGQ